MTQTPTRTRMETLARPADRLGTGRLGSYAVMGAAIGSVPIPFIPGALGSRLRGALIYDVARRHGLSLSKDARSVLSAPFAPPMLQGTIGRVAAFAASRVLGRLGPLGMLSPVGSGALTYILGRLFHRYVSELRKDPTVRIDADEARKVRKAMEQAIFRAFSTPAESEHVESTEPEDVRDEITKLTDGLIATAASLPSWLTRRLDAAFDAAFVA